VTRTLLFFVLGCIVLCIVLSQVLLQVNLPDTAFRIDTLPLIARSRVTPHTPVVLRATIQAPCPVSKLSSEVDREQSLVHTVPLAKFLPTLLCSLLC